MKTIKIFGEAAAMIGYVGLLKSFIQNLMPRYWQWMYTHHGNHSKQNYLTCIVKPIQPHSKKEYQLKKLKL